jgi:hypothetical protein
MKWFHFDKGFENLKTFDKITRFKGKVQVLPYLKFSLVPAE